MMRCCVTRVAPHICEILHLCAIWRSHLLHLASRDLSPKRTPSQTALCCTDISPLRSAQTETWPVRLSMLARVLSCPVGASGSSSVREPLSCACVCAPLPISCQAHHFPVGRLLRHRLAAQTRLRRGTMLVMAPSALRALAENELASSRSLSASSRCRRSFSSRASASSAVWAARSTPKSLASV